MDQEALKLKVTIKRALRLQQFDVLIGKAMLVRNGGIEYTVSATYTVETGLVLIASHSDTEIARFKVNLGLESISPPEEAEPINSTENQL
jgi:hypothetical protein